MILKRIGRKTKIAPLVTPNFPEHKNYIETFFGSGGIFFEKPKSKNNFLNDLDGEVFNFWMVCQNDMYELIKQYEFTPYSLDIFNHWKQVDETDPVRRALRFMYLANFSLMGKGKTMRFRTNAKPKDVVLQMASKVYEFISDVNFMNVDFREVFKKIAFETGKYKAKDLAETFAYNDPPYVDAPHYYYNTPKWTRQDFIDLLECNISWGVKFAISESNHPFVVKEAKARGLNIIPIKKRSSMAGSCSEILITNYYKQLQIFG
jgi:DNA adenine methylase